MLGQATFIALLSAAAVSANGIQTLMSRSNNLFTRQLTAASIPSACQSTCLSTITIYQACTAGGDLATCVSVCQPSNYASFTGCLQCIVNNAPGASSTDVATLNSALQSLDTLCNQAGTPVQGTTLVPSTGASGASGSADVSATASVSGSGLSSASAVGTSSAGGLGASASSVSSRAGGIGSSISSGLGGLSASSTSGGATQARTSAPAATSTGAAGAAAPIAQRGVVAGLVGVVGLAAGAVMVL